VPRAAQPFDAPLPREVVVAIKSPTMSGEEEVEVNSVTANRSIAARGAAPTISKMLTSMETLVISIKDTMKEAMDVDMVMAGIKVTASRITIETRVVVVVSTLVGDGTILSNALRL
jgi:hypothetical protein